MRGAAAAVNVGAGGVWVDRAIEMAQVEEHELGVILQLDTEPVPARLKRFQLVSEPLVIHPRGAGHGGAVERSFNGQERKRNVVRRLAQALGLLADAILAID